MIHERQCAIWRPVKRGVGFAAGEFQLFQFVGLLAGIVVWHFAHHASRSETEWRSVSLGCAMARGKRQPTGEGRVSSLLHPSPWDQFTILRYLGIGHNCTVV